MSERAGDKSGVKKEKFLWSRMDCVAAVDCMKERKKIGLYFFGVETGERSRKLVCGLWVYGRVWLCVCVH